jgi:hypothetical protein
MKQTQTPSVILCPAFTKSPQEAIELTQKTYWDKEIWHVSCEGFTNEDFETLEVSKTKVKAQPDSTPVLNNSFFQSLLNS